MELTQLSIDSVDDGPNVRRVVDKGLRQSIREYGVLQPIVVVPVGDRYEVLYGHRRLAGARAAGHRMIPALVQERRPRDLGLHQLVENVDRRELDPIDIAHAIQAALEENPGLTKERLAARLGRKSSYVSNKLALLRMSEDVQERVKTRELPEHVAIKQYRPRVDDGRGRPRIIPLESEHGNSASVEVNFDHGKATIGVDRDERHVELLLFDTFGRSTAITLSPHEAKLLGRRLTQAYEATA